MALTDPIFFGNSFAFNCGNRYGFWRTPHTRISPARPEPRSLLLLIIGFINFRGLRWRYRAGPGPIRIYTRNCDLNIGPRIRTIDFIFSLAPLSFAIRAEFGMSPDSAIGSGAGACFLRREQTSEAFTRVRRISNRYSNAPLLLVDYIQKSWDKGRGFTF